MSFHQMIITWLLGGGAMLGALINLHRGNDTPAMILSLVAIACFCRVVGMRR